MNKNNPLEYNSAVSAEQALRNLMEKISIEDFSRQAEQITYLLAQSLEMTYALISKRLDTPILQVRSLAFWNGWNWSQPFNYLLEGSPCEKIYKEGYYCFTHQVQQMFPQDRELNHLNVESYAGAPILGSDGQAIGHVCVLDTKPIFNIAHVYRLLHLTTEKLTPILGRLNDSQQSE